MKTSYNGCQAQADICISIQQHSCLLLNLSRKKIINSELAAEFTANAHNSTNLINKISTLNVTISLLKLISFS